MKKKAIITLSICVPILVVIIFFGAIFLSIILDDTDYHWEFEKNYSDVKSIMIIETEEPWYDSQWQNHNFDILLEIDISHANTVFYDVKSLNFHRYGPNLASGSGKAILIIFNNEEYDLITCREPQHYRYDKRDGKIQGYTSWLYCDETQFNELINKYLEQ